MKLVLLQTSLHPRRHDDLYKDDDSDDHDGQVEAGTHVLVDGIHGYEADCAVINRLNGDSVKREKAGPGRSEDSVVRQKGLTIERADPSTVGERTGILGLIPPETQPHCIQ
jgi:hypothetical protein